MQTIHYTRKEWHALSTEKRLAYFNDPWVRIVFADREVRVTFN